MRLPSFAALLLLLAGSAHAAESDSFNDFTESKGNDSRNIYLEGLHKSTNRIEAQLAKESTDILSARTRYAKFNNRVRVPGFISSTPIPQVAHIAGPVLPADTSLRMGDTIFLRWSGSPLPRAGDRYATYSPAVVLQDMEKPTDFEVFAVPGPNTKIPKGRRLAGYLYETTARVRILKISGGTVTATIEQLSGRLGIGDELMEMPPLLSSVTPINNGIQLSAAVVCGSPVDRLSTTVRSFIYLNRGSRDGIRVGRVFESIENVKTDQPLASPPEFSNGEAIVIHVTDSYSTAMITKQFDVIRIGSLLRAKQGDGSVIPVSPFYGFPVDGKDKTAAGKPSPEAGAPDAGKDAALPEIPALEKMSNTPDDTLPEPRKRPSRPALSDLDQLEQSMSPSDLTSDEKSKLDKLSRQEKVGANETPTEGLSDTPGNPSVENSFGDKAAKKPVKKKSKSKNDEEELNLLMMQN